LQIQLVQSEIENAIREYVLNMGITSPINEVNFTAGRSGAGITAAIEISPRKDSTDVVVAVDLAKQGDADKSPEEPESSEETSESTDGTTSLFST